MRKTRSHCTRIRKARSHCTPIRKTRSHCTHIRKARSHCTPIRKTVGDKTDLRTDFPYEGHFNTQKRTECPTGTSTMIYPMLKVHPHFIGLIIDIFFNEKKAGILP